MCQKSYNGLEFFFFIGKYGKDKPDHKPSQTGEALPLGNPNNLQG